MILMKIEGTVDNVNKKVSISLPVVFEDKTDIINFVVDTGASVTTLGFLDLEKLTGRNAKELPRNDQPVMGIGGNVDSRILKGRFLILSPEGEIVKEDSHIVTTVPKLKRGGRKLDLQNPKVRRYLGTVFPSLLGMDIISKGILHIDFRNNEVYLEIP